MKNLYLAVEVLRVRETDANAPAHVVITGVGPFGGSRASLAISRETALILARRIIGDPQLERSAG